MGRSRFPGKPFKFQNRKRISIVSGSAINENASESVNDGCDANDSCRETSTDEKQGKEEKAENDQDISKDATLLNSEIATDCKDGLTALNVVADDCSLKSSIRTRSQQKMEVGKNLDCKNKNVALPVKKTVTFGRVESCDSYKPLKKLPYKQHLPLIPIIKKKSAFKSTEQSFSNIVKPAKLTDLSSKISVDFSEFRAKNSHSPPLRKSAGKFSQLTGRRLSPPPAFADKDSLSLKKFVLPSKSIHSSRVIKPNKRFIETEESTIPLHHSNLTGLKVLKKPKLVFGSHSLDTNGAFYDEAYETCDSSANSNDSVDMKNADVTYKTLNLFQEKTLGLFGSGLISGNPSFHETFSSSLKPISHVNRKLLDKSDGEILTKAKSEDNPEEQPDESLLRHSIQSSRATVDTPCTSDQSSNSSTSESSDSETSSFNSESENETDLDTRSPTPERTTTSQLLSGKVILREARLQLSSPNVQANSGTEGPFSSFSNSANNGTVTCGVCGAVRFYRFVKQARKFGIYTCESCRKFMSKMIKRSKVSEAPSLQCIKGEAIVRSQQWKLFKCAYNARCPACWLKMCLKAFHIPQNLKASLQAMLPSYMKPNNSTVQQTPVQINPLRPLNQSGTLTSPLYQKNKHDKIVTAESQPAEFSLGNTSNTIKKSKSSVTNENNKKDNPEKSIKKKVKEKSQKEDISEKREQIDDVDTVSAGRKRRHTRVKVRKKTKIDPKEIDTKRQKVELKGPRVKHVCRSASIVLGQPIATFPANDVKETVKIAEHSTKSESMDVEKENTPKTDILTDSCTDCDIKEEIKSDDGGDKSENDNILMEISKDKSDKSIQKVVDNLVEANLEKKRKVSNDSFGLAKADTDTEDHGVEVAQRKVLKQYVSNTTNVRSYQRQKPSDKTVSDFVLTDFWEIYDPDEVCKTGWGLIGTQPFSLLSVCFLCGSKGREKLLFCAGCCESYHPFCVETASPGATTIVGTNQKIMWLCPNCVVCKACNKHMDERADTYCYNCKGFFHANCLTANLNGKYRSDWPKICSACLKCKSCDSFKVTKFLGSLPFCSSCFRLRQKGNYCPLCQGCYQDNDFDSKMMECGWCSRWVHARCEGLSGEGYQLLSALPHNVEYICRQCLPDNPPWREMLGTYLRGKLLALLKILAKNKDACALLKLTPHKNSPAENKLCLCESPIAVRKLMFDDEPMERSPSENIISTNNTDSTQFFRTKKLSISDRLSSLSNMDTFPHSRPIMHKIMVVNLQESLMQNKEICFSTGVSNVDNFNDTNVNGLYEMRDCCVKVNDNSHSSEDENEMQVALGSDVQTSVRLVPTAVHDDKYENISDDDELVDGSLNDNALVIHKDDQNPPSLTIACLQGHSANVDCPCVNIKNREAAPSLLDVKKRVNANEYVSLKEFNGDMLEAIQKTQSENLKKVYKDIFVETFPWFDCESNCLNPDLEIEDDCEDTESLKDEDLGENTRKSRINVNINSLELEDHVVPKSALEMKDFDDYVLDESLVEDIRSCILCKSSGEGQPSVEGRLLYCGQNDWIHANCALWSNEVFEEIDGSLQNVQSAIARSKTIKCALCDTKGASVSCCTRNCNTSYHFRCARQSDCAFLDDKRVFCPIHAVDVKEKLQKENDFEMIRPVYVELDRKRKKYSDPNNVQFLLGSLTVKKMGRIVPSVSDYEDILIPADFVCSKLYWSSKQPWKIIQYTIKSKLLLAEPLPGIDFGVNITVDHSLNSSFVDRIMAEISSWHKTLATKEHNMIMKKDSPIKFRSNASITLEGIAVKQVMDHLIDLVCKNEQDDSPEEEPQNTADLLPPELKDAIFEDLNHDLLDGISMQDIFPKLMSYEDLVAMDLKSEYFNNEVQKESKINESSEDTNSKQIEENSATMREKKSESWSDTKTPGNDILDELLNTRLEAGIRELKRSKSEVFLQNANVKNITNKSHQRSCSLTWNCKLDGTIRTPLKKHKIGQSVNKLDANTAIHTTNVSPNILTNSSLPKIEADESPIIIEKHWQSKHQIRLIQMDGTMDSASESGSSTRSVDEDQFQALPSSPIVNGKSKDLQNSEVLNDNVIDFYTKMQCSPIAQLDGADDFSSSDSECSSPVLSPAGPEVIDFTPISQLDGADEISSSGSESNSPRNPTNQIYFRANSNEASYTVTLSSGPAGEMLMRSPIDDGFLRVAQIEHTVRCDRCHCTYRNKESYDRHLPSCDMMSTSESESETPKSPESRTLNTAQLSFHNSFIQPTSMIPQHTNFENMADIAKPGMISSRRTSVNTRQITINGTIVETPSPSPSNDSFAHSDISNNGKSHNIILDTSKQNTLMNQQILTSPQIIVNSALPISPPKTSIGNHKIFNQQIISAPSTGLPYNICMKPANLNNHGMSTNGNINHIITSGGNLQNAMSSNSNQVLTIAPHQQNIAPALHSKPQTIQTYTTIPNTSISLQANSLQGIPTSLGNSLLQNIQPLIRPQLQPNSTILMPSMNARLASPNSQHKAQILLPHCSQKSPKKQPSIQTKPIIQGPPRAKGKAITKTATVKRQTRLDKPLQAINQAMPIGSGNTVIQLQHNQSGQPSIIVQQVQNPNIMSYVEALSQQQGQNLQYITTIGPQGDFKPSHTQFISQGGLVPQTFQIQQTENGGLVAVPSGGIPVLLPQGGVGILPQSALPPGTTILPQGGILPQGTIQTQNGTTLIPQTAIQTQNGTTLIPQSTIQGLNQSQGPTLLPSNTVPSQGPTIVPQSSIGNTQATILPQTALQSQGGTIISQPSGTATILPQGATILPQGIQFCNDQVLLGSTPTLEMVTDPSGCMYLTTQPVYYGLETIVQNTVMSSQQFVSTAMQGVLAQNSSFSATTTQVFQASKIEPIVEMPTGYVVVNNVPQDNIITSQGNVSTPTLMSPQSMTSLQQSQNQKNMKPNTMTNISVQSGPDKVNTSAIPRSSIMKNSHPIMTLSHSSPINIQGSHGSVTSTSGPTLHQSSQVRCQPPLGQIKQSNISIQPMHVTSPPSSTHINVSQSIANNLVVSNCNISTMSQPIVSSAITPSNIQKHPISMDLSEPAHNSQECSASSHQILNLPVSVQQLIRNHPGAQVWRMPINTSSNINDGTKQHINLPNSVSQGNDRLQGQKMPIPSNMIPPSVPNVSVSQNIPSNVRNYNQYGSLICSDNVPLKANSTTCVSISTSNSNINVLSNLNNQQITQNSGPHVGNHSLCQQFSNHASITNQSSTTTASSPTMNSQSLDGGHSSHNVNIHQQNMHSSDSEIGRQHFQTACNVRQNAHGAMENVDNPLIHAGSFVHQQNNAVQNDKMFHHSSVPSNVNSGHLDNFSAHSINNQMQNIIGNGRVQVGCVMSNHSSGNMNHHIQNMQTNSNMGQCIISSNQSGNLSNQSHSLHNNTMMQNSLNQQMISMGNSSSPNTNHVCPTANNRIHLVNNNGNANNMQVNMNSNQINMQMGGNMHIQQSNINHCSNHSSAQIGNNNQQFSASNVTNMQPPVNGASIHSAPHHMMNNNGIYGSHTVPSNQPSMSNCSNRIDITTNQSQIANIIHGQSQCVGSMNHPQMPNNSLSSGESQMGNNVNSQIQMSSCMNIQPQHVNGVNNQVQLSGHINSQSQITNNSNNHDLVNNSARISSEESNQLISNSINNQLTVQHPNIGSHPQLANSLHDQSQSGANIQLHMPSNLHSHLHNQTVMQASMNNQNHMGNSLIHQAQNSNINSLNVQFTTPQPINVPSQLTNVNVNVMNNHVHGTLPNSSDNQTRMENSANTSYSSGNNHGMFNQNNHIQALNNLPNGNMSSQMHTTNSNTSGNIHHNMQNSPALNMGNHLHQMNNAQNMHTQMALMNASQQPQSGEMISHGNSHNSTAIGPQLNTNNQVGNDIALMTNNQVNISQVPQNNSSQVIHSHMLNIQPRVQVSDNRVINNQEVPKHNVIDSSTISNTSHDIGKTGNMCHNERSSNLVSQTLSDNNQLGFLQINNSNNRIINLPERNQINNPANMGNSNSQTQIINQSAHNANLTTQPSDVIMQGQSPNENSYDAAHSFVNNSVHSIRNALGTAQQLIPEQNQLQSSSTHKPLSIHATQNQSTTNQAIHSKPDNSQVSLMSVNNQQMPPNPSNIISLPIHNVNTISLPVQSSSSISLPKAPTHQSGLPTNVVNPMSTRPMNRVLPIHRDAQAKSAARLTPQVPPRIVPPRPPKPPSPRNQDMPDLNIKEEDMIVDSDLEKAIEESKRTLELEQQKREEEATAAAIAESQNVQNVPVQSEANKVGLPNKVNPAVEASALKMVFQKHGESGRVYKVSSKKEKENKVDLDLSRANISAKVEQKIKRTIEGLSKSESTQILLQKKIPMRTKQLQESHTKTKQPIGSYRPAKDDTPKMLYEITSEDGFSYSSTSLTDLWIKVVEAVQNARKQHGLTPLQYILPPNLPGSPLLALHNNALKYLVEQLPGASRCVKYKALNGRKILSSWDTDLGLDEGFKESASGCARAGIYIRKPSHDIFNWLASSHRDPPIPLNLTQDGELTISRRFTSSTMPMATRFRHLKETSKLAVGVYRSHIHGRGLFCRRDIDAGEMVIEYAGEVIRAVVADGRERKYESGNGRTSSRVHGCYMFRIDDRLVVDATMKGNAARFINHSCDPNCYSRVVDILGHKHIIIFALRKIIQGEELTYDYKFPFEDVKIPCTCRTKRCRKYLN